MDSVYVRNLIMTVIKHSESEYWEDAVTEWKICTIVKRVDTIFREKYLRTVA